MKDAEILRVVGKNVREARRRATYTQECLAELVGIHWQTLSYIERGKYPFAVTTFARLVQHLKTSPNRLLDGLKPADEARIAHIVRAKARRRKPISN